jgi:glycosyltransferase involved in cell wall biosynthesis
LPQLTLWDAQVPTGSARQELLRLLWRLLWLQLQLARMLGSRQPRVCVLHGFQAALLAWPLALLRRDIRWIYVHRVTKAAGAHGIFRLVYLPFHIVAGNSHAVTASFSRLVPPGRLATLDNGLDWRRFEERVAKGADAPLPTAHGPVLITVGRMLPHKNQELVIGAFLRLAAAHPEASLWLAGDGPEQPRLQAMAARTTFSARIHFLGTRTDVPAVLSRATIFTNASSWEGMSNAVLEGLAAGLPAVVVDAPGVTECHVDGVTGFVVAPDVAAVASALDQLLGDSALRARMGAAGRARVRERYSIEANRERYLSLFKRLS